MAEDRVARAMAMDAASGGSAVQSDWAQSDTTADDYIKNKPTLGTAAALDMDAVLSGSSTNPVQNKAVKAETDKLGAGLAEAINGGAKNMATVNSSASTAKWIDVPISISAGQFAVSFASLSATNQTSNVRLGFLAGTVEVSGVYRVDKGTNVSVLCTVDDTADTLRVYAGTNSTEAASNSVSFSGLMLCTKAAWDASQAYEPYAPTNRELYEMILALQT